LLSTPTNLSYCISNITFLFAPPNIFCNLSSGAITSGLDLAPGYSPTRPNVGPNANPPFAND